MEWLPGNPEYEFCGNEKKEDDLHMKMRIIFLFVSNPASQMPKSVFVLNLVDGT